MDASVNSTNNINTVSPTINAASLEDNDVDENIVYGCANDSNIHDLEEIGKFSDVENDDSGADINNLDTYFQVSHVPTTRIHKDHPLNQVIGDLQSATQTRQMTKNLEEYGFVSTTLKQRTSHKDLQNCLFACFLSQEEPKKELNGSLEKKDERGIVIKNKARLVAQGYTQEKGIDYDKVFAPVAKIEAIRLFFAYALFKDFVVYQMDVKSAFLYGKIEEEVYVCQPPEFEDPNFLDRRGQIDKTLFIKRDKGDIMLVQVYVDDIIFGSTNKSLCTEFKKMMHKKFQMSSMGELTFFLGLQVKQKEDGIFISQEKYVTKILKKFSFSDVKTASTPMETHKPLLKDANGEDVDEHLYISMIGLLMYLTSSRPGIMFAVCTCARFQVNPKVSHLHAVKRIFRYLKGASLDRKSTTGVTYYCQLKVNAVRHNLLLLANVNDVEDAEGIECLPNADIFEELALMGVGKGFSRAVTPLFPTLMVQAQEEMGEEPVADEAVYEERDDNLERATTTAASLDAEYDMVLNIETTKTTQAKEIANLKKRVKKLEKKKKSRTHGLKRLYKVGLSARIVSSDDEAKNVYNEDMFDTCVFNNEEVFTRQDMAEKEISTTDPFTTAANVEVKLKSARPKRKRVVMQEPSETTTTTIPSKDKGKGYKLNLIRKEKKEVNAALIAQWNDIQDKVKTDYELAQRLQAEEQEELTIKEKSKLFQQLFDKRRKHFAAKRAEERRNKPPSKAQKRSIMTTYLKNMVGWKPKDLNNEIREEESNSKRAGDELEQEPSKKQKIEDDKETVELQISAAGKKVTTVGVES
ncbi:putative ribonuclease H-like domain-containing protein [Tanacetum coccineum]